MKIHFSGLLVFRALVIAVLLAIGYELGGIWLEVKGMRQEQVKNAVYSMRPDAIARIRNSANGEIRIRHLTGEVSIVADETLPVDIQE
jgi:hypothetical protein